MKVAWFAAMTAAAVGCGRNPAPAPPTPATPPAVTEQAATKSSVSTVIDGLTGKAAVEAGRKARTQIEKIGQQEQHDINEAMSP
jgi:hypothetical protein